MKTIKKALSILLVLATLFSISTVSTLSVSAATYSESESNDSYSTADTLKVGNKIEGKMNSYTDIDIYKVSVPSSGRLTFTFKHTHVDDGWGWKVRIYQCSDGNYVLLSENKIYGNSDEKIVLPFVGTRASETYYVHIDTGYDATVNQEYIIESNFISSSYECYEKEENNSYATATSISANREYGGYMNSYTDVDIYKITTSKSGKLTFNFMHEHVDDGWGWEISIYQCLDGKYTELSKSKIYGSSDAKVELPSINTVSSAIYYLKVKTGYSAAVHKEYSIIAKSSTEPSVDIGTGGSDNNNDNNDASDPGFSFMDVLNAVLDFFKWLFQAVLSFFS